jgi:hypothetical protein
MATFFHENAATTIVALIDLVRMGDATQIGLVLFVLHRLRLYLPWSLTCLSLTHFLWQA